MAELVHDGKTRFSSPIPRSVLRDKRLSYGARGLFAFLWDLPAGWNVRLSHLEKTSPEGRDALRSRLRELEKVGAVIIEPIRGEKGKLNGKRWRIVSPDRWAIESPLSEKRVSQSSVKPNIGHANAKVIQDRSTYKKDEAEPAARRHKYGDNIVIHGVEVWTKSDKNELHTLINKHGADYIEKVAAELNPAPGHLAPYVSALNRELSERSTKAKSDSAKSAQKRREEEFIKNAPPLHKFTDEEIARLPEPLRQHATRK